MITEVVNESPVHPAMFAGLLSDHSITKQQMKQFYIRQNDGSSFL